jgi:hypothetical protein
MEMQISDVIWGIFIHIQSDPKDFIDTPWRGEARRSEARHGMARQGKDSFNNLTDSELLSMTQEVNRTTPGAIRKEEKNENPKVSDYRRSTPSYAQRPIGESV